MELRRPFRGISPFGRTARACGRSTGNPGRAVVLAVHRQIGPWRTGPGTAPSRCPALCSAAALSVPAGPCGLPLGDLALPGRRQPSPFSSGSRRRVIRSRPGQRARFAGVPGDRTTSRRSDDSGSPRPGSYQRHHRPAQPRSVSCSSHAAAARCPAVPPAAPASRPPPRAPANAGTHVRAHRIGPVAATRPPPRGRRVRPQGQQPSRGSSGAGRRRPVQPSRILPAAVPLAVPPITTHGMLLRPVLQRPSVMLMNRAALAHAAASDAVTSGSDAERPHDRWPVAGENSRPGMSQIGELSGTT